MLNETELIWTEWNGEERGPAQAHCLDAQTVHFWELRASGDWIPQLKTDEKQSLGKMTNPEVRSDYATTQAGLRQMLSHYRKEAPGDVNIERGPQGKPYVQGGPEFNLSHTHGGIYVAVSSQPIGLDVEAAERRVHGMELARKFFSAAEVYELDLLPPEEQNAAFIRRWVSKEAMVKLSGEGIFLGLREALTRTVAGRGMMGRFRGREVCLQEMWPQQSLRATLATWTPVEVKGFFRL